LKLDKLEFSKGRKHRLEILLGDIEVNIAHVEAVERDRIGMAAALRVAHLAIFLRLGDLNNDGDT